MSMEQTMPEYGDTLAEPVLVLQDQTHLFWTTVTQHPVPVVMGIFTGFCAWSLTSLLLYHARIISIGETTNERYRHVYARERNPSDLGCCRNWSLCLQRSVGRQLPVSRLPRDFSVTVREPPWKPFGWETPPPPSHRPILRVVPGGGVLPAVVVRRRWGVPQWLDPHTTSWAGMRHHSSNRMSAILQ
jgi:hypothetical protein